jgi:hypothetical protein
MVPVAATIAISDQLLVAGSDRSAVEQAITRSPPRADTLADSQLFTAGERLVPQAKSAFVYIDIARLYTRLDAAIRPMLVLAATFVPSIAETVDLTKLPPAEVVTKHLTPFVLSQTYETDGYVTESIGPVSIYHAGVGIAIAGGFTKNWYAASPTPSTVPDDAADARASVPTSEASATPTTEPQ